jgi:ceramide glucosyltransferase
MALNFLLGSLAVLSLLLTLWQWLVAHRFPLHSRSTAIPADAHAPPRSPLPAPTLFAPPITLLKPLKGADRTTESCLRSWFSQDYPGLVQILFGVASADDPVCAIVRGLLQEFPARDAQLLICGPLLGANLKVSKLAQLERLAKHDLVLISDADVRVSPDFLANVVAPFEETSALFATPVNAPVGSPETAKTAKRLGVRQSPAALSAHQEAGRGLAFDAGGPLESGRGLPHSKTLRAARGTLGLVTCFYRLANPTTLAMQWEAVAVNADFWSQVLQAQSLRPIDFALGAVMLTRRSCLAQIGGFAALADCLADDYQLGHRLVGRGFRIALCPVVVECWAEPMGWTTVWKHQLRWARTIRVCQPLPYFFSILSNPTLWPLLWLAAFHGKLQLAFALTSCAVRLLTAAHLHRRLQGASSSFSYSSSTWLPLLKDLLQAAIWLLAFLGNRVEWRGQKMRIRPDGTLVRPS